MDDDRLMEEIDALDALRSDGARFDAALAALLARHRGTPQFAPLLAFAQTLLDGMGPGALPQTRASLDPRERPAR